MIAKTIKAQSIKNNRNNGNVEKLISKYNELAREALSNGDKILSENYFQHAEHFIRIQKEKDSFMNKNQELKVNNSSNLENKKDLNNLEKDIQKEDVSTKS